MLYKLERENALIGHSVLLRMFLFNENNFWLVSCCCILKIRYNFSPCTTADCEECQCLHRGTVVEPAENSSPGGPVWR